MRVSDRRDGPIVADEKSNPFLVHTESFNGPLDLLLHLVRRHEVPIEQVPLAQITGEYVETLELMAELELEPAAEFLEVAATLMRFKARALLPRPAVPEDPELAAQEETALLQQLVEHQVVRLAAQQLRHRESQAAAVWFRGEVSPAGIEASDTEIVEADLFTLVTAFRNVVAGLAEPASFEVAREKFSVAECSAEIHAKLAAGVPIPFLELFESGAPRGKLIATFLALLDLIRGSAVRAFQDGPLGTILVFSADADDDVSPNETTA